KKKPNIHKKEFGDFQTPSGLAQDIINHIKQTGFTPATIIEPNCGLGSFILASIRTFPDSIIIGMDINPRYVTILHQKLDKIDLKKPVKIEKADFFEIDWSNLLNSLQEPYLIIGNPPWVTSSEISTLNGSNVPFKSNIYGFNGIAAKTGKSNFDISEWMTITLLNSLNGHYGTLAFICKFQVARKVLIYINKNNLSVSSSYIRLIDAKDHFNAVVNACLFICNLKPNSSNYGCKVYPDLDSQSIVQEIGYYENQLIADIPNYLKWKHLQGKAPYIWRSGIKHDCSKVMELIKKGDHFYNGFKKLVSIEDDYLYPMLKSADLANISINKTKRWMLVTQRFIGEETFSIKDRAPLTWAYLETYSQVLDQRKSSVYKNRPKYSIFGVGDYSFSPWKIAISGFYKKLTFQCISPLYEKPVVLDDTCYFIPAKSPEEALILHTILNHPFAHDFYHTFIFWDAKRPITKQILQQLDLCQLSKEIGSEEILEVLYRNYSGLNSKSLNSALDNVQNEQTMGKKRTLLDYT
ncbi:MAG: SAM-dependent DNA methyltransferase, partial [Promethearchaeota archaeon]